MKIKYEGKSYTFDFADIEVRQAIMIEAHTGMLFGEWSRAVAVGASAKAMQAVGWLVLAGGDLATPIEDCNFRLARLGEAFSEAYEAQAAAEAAAEAAGPTQPPPPPSGNGGA